MRFPGVAVQGDGRAREAVPAPPRRLLAQLRLAGEAAGGGALFLFLSWSCRCPAFHGCFRSIRIEDHPLRGSISFPLPDASVPLLVVVHTQARHQGTDCPKVVLYCQNKGCHASFERSVSQVGDFEFNAVEPICLS